jgi:hypothetical protein
MALLQQVTQPVTPIVEKPAQPEVRDNLSPASPPVPSKEPGKQENLDAVINFLRMAANRKPDEGSEQKEVSDKSFRFPTLEDLFNGRLV